MMKRTPLALLLLLMLTAVLSTVGCGVGSTTPASNPTFTKLTFNSNRTVDPATSLFIMGLDGSTQAPVPATASCCVYSSSISADAKKIAYSYNGNVWTSNADGSTQTQLTTDNNSYYSRISPNGKKIIFNAPDPVSSQWVLHLMNVDGTAKTPLLTTLPTDMTQCWNGAFSADSAKVVFTCWSNSTSTYGLYTAKADGTGLATVLTQADSQYINTPAFSADGKKIVFVSYGLTDAPNYGVVTINLDGTNKTVIALGGYESEVLNASVYYTFYDTTLSTSRIYKISLDGTNPVALTDGTSYDYLGLNSEP